MRWSPTRFTPLAAASALAVLGLAACQPYQFRGHMRQDPKPAPDFTLTDHTSQPFRLSEQADKVNVLFFGFTSCPDICPTTLSKLSSVMDELGEAADDVQVVMVTVDPERDTVEKMATYVTAFGPQFTGVRGDRYDLDPVYRDYGVFAERRDLPDSALGYTIDHSGYLYIIDKQGRWRATFSHNDAMEDIASDLLQLTKESS